MPNNKDNNKTEWFETFFNSLINSTEYKAMVWEFESKKTEKELTKIDKTIKKAGNIMGSFNEIFTTPEAIKSGNNYSSSSKIEQKTTKTSNEENTVKIEVKYFENKNPKTWGFAGIAGLEDLKQELKESFINPLKFKFLVEGLEKQKSLPQQDSSPQPSPEGEGELDKKNELYIKLHDAYEKLKVSIPTGLLMYGPPWTWKTFISKKLAQELWAGFISKSMWELGSSYMHQTTQNIKTLFTIAKKASQKGPIILFLDEIDSLVSSRTDRVDANKAEEVSQFLQEFNKLAKEAPNLIVIAATNRPDHLDSALLRSGRLDKKIYIWIPDFETRKALFKVFIEKFDRPHSKLDYNKLAKLTEWYVAADIENIVKEASRDASQWILELVNLVESSWDKVDFNKINKDLEKHVLTQKLLEQAIKDTISSVKMIDMSVYEKWKEKVS